MTMRQSFKELRSQYIDHKLVKLINHRNQRLTYKSSFAIPAHDYISTEVTVSGWYERDILEAVIEILGKNNLLHGNFIDIGANIGNHSIFMSYYFDQVFAFEPLAQNYRYLQFNAELRPNIKTFQTGLGSSNTVVTMKSCPGNRGKSGQFVGDATWVHEDVQIQKFDQIDKVGSPSVVKIDVEGAELSVLQGMAACLESDQPLLMIETDFSTQPELVEFLRQKNYTYFYTLDTPFRSGRGILGKLLKAFRPGNQKWKQIAMDDRSSFYELALVSSRSLIA